jgi:hypothetical protein
MNGHVSRLGALGPCPRRCHPSDPPAQGQSIRPPNSAKALLPRHPAFRAGPAPAVIPDPGRDGRTSRGRRVSLACPTELPVAG